MKPAINIEQSSIGASIDNTYEELKPCYSFRLMINFMIDNTYEELKLGFTDTTINITEIDNTYEELKLRTQVTPETDAYD